MGTIRIGISGWRYPGWRGVFYPPGLPQRSELAYAARCFGSVEINGSFYSLQRPESYADWYRATPDGFVFAVKGGRFITHFLKLRESERPLANFFASGVLALREKLGPLLWQLPPQLGYDPERLERFLALLPHDSEAALALARRRDTRMRGRTHLAIDRRRRIRHAVEIRHESYCEPSFVRLLRRHRVALVVSDGAGRWPRCDDVTADFVYVRLHGAEELYASGYSDRALARWAARIRAWAASEEPDDATPILPPPRRRPRSRDVYCYFDNDAKVRAPFDAMRLARALGLGRPSGEAVTAAGSRAPAARRAPPASVPRPARALPASPRARAAPSDTDRS